MFCGPLPERDLRRVIGQHHYDDITTDEIGVHEAELLPARWSVWAQAPELGGAAASRGPCILGYIVPCYIALVTPAPIIAVSVVLAVIFNAMVHDRCCDAMVAAD